MTSEEIFVTFSEFGLEEAQKSEIEHLLKIQISNGIDAETLGDKWVTWKLNSKLKSIKESDVITEELISRFENESRVNIIKRPKPVPLIFEKVAKVARVDVDFGSPASVTFSDRKDKGRVLVTIGGEIVPTDTDEIAIKLISEKSNFNYMAQNRREIADILADYISDACELLEEKLQIVDPHPIAMPIQEVVTICGMIIMEGQKGSDGIFVLRDENEVKLDLEQVEEYSLFPGIICGLEGNNPTGDAFVVTKIIHQEIPPVEETGRVVDDTTIMIASGPFFTSDSVSDDPLNELKNEVTTNAPHLLLLFGPFLDAKHIGVNSITSNQLDALLAEKLDEIKTCGTEVLLIPSPADFFADPIMPTPAFDTVDFAKCSKYFIGGPAAIWANGWNLAGTSNDIILQLMRHEFVHNLPGDKLKRISEYLLRGQQMMPLTPPPETVSLDYGQFHRLKMPWTPNLLITPSDMIPFARQTGDTLVVNPGRLTKGKGGGSFAIVQLNSEMHRAKIVKI